MLINTDSKIITCDSKTNKALSSNSSSTSSEASFSERDYFIEAMKGNTYFSKPYASHVGGLFQVVIATPIYDGNEIKGVLYLANSAETFVQITNDVSLGETGKAFMVSEDGTIITSSDIDEVNNQLNYINLAKENPSYTTLGNVVQKMIAGKGFSVVAEEIRDLAEQSKHSTQNIYQIVETLFKQTHSIFNISAELENSITDGKNDSRKGFYFS